MSSSDSTPPPPPTPRHRGLIDEAELAPYRTGIRWRFWAPVLVVLIAFPIVWWVKRHREAVERREALLREHATLTATLAPEFRARRATILAAIQSDVGNWQGPMRSPSLTLEALTQEPVLYGRVRVHEVNDEASAERSLLHRYPDQFAGCLGIETRWARELLDKGSFLLPQFVDAVRGSDDSDRLHALREDLLYRLRRDTATLTDALRPRYFVLVVDEARVSVDGPSRVFVHDLTSREVLLRARGVGDEVAIIPFRVTGIPAAPPRTDTLPRMGLSQHDCSIANSVRRAFGAGTAGLDNAPPTAPLDAGQPADAGVRDAASGDAAR